jgi:small subunit ribosomal protein S2
MSGRKAVFMSTQTTETSYTPDIDVKQLLEAGSHFGHQAKRWHPKMEPYIYAKRDGVHIFDLIITAEKLKAAAELVYELGKSGKSVVFVGTKRQAKEIVKEEAIQSGAMYIVNRWLGGFISNWEQVSKSNREMISIRKGLEDGSYKNYTKKERLLLEKKIQRLERFFGGVSELKQKPDALFIIDAGREKTAIKEAISHNIPVIGMVDSNDDPTPIDYVVPANDDAARSIKYIVHVIAEAYKAGKAAKQ